MIFHGWLILESTEPVALALVARVMRLLASFPTNSNQTGHKGRGYRLPKTTN